jgi:hypothetical protein
VHLLRLCNQNRLSIGHAQRRRGVAGILHGLAGQILGQLHVGLIEWLNANHGTCGRDAHFPTKKFLPQINDFAQREMKNRIPRFFQRGDRLLIQILFRFQRQMDE